MNMKILQWCWLFTPVSISLPLGSFPSNCVLLTYSLFHLFITGDSMWLRMTIIDRFLWPHWWLGWFSSDYIGKKTMSLPYLFDPTGELPIVKISLDKSQKEPEQKEFQYAIIWRLDEVPVSQMTSWQVTSDIVTSIDQDVFDKVPVSQMTSCHHPSKHLVIFHPGKQLFIFVTFSVSSSWV